MEHDMTAINFDLLFEAKEMHKRQYREASPFPCLVIDNFLTDAAVNQIRDREICFTAMSNTNSSDYMFAKNKIETPDLNVVGGIFANIGDELLQGRFARWLSYVTGEGRFYRSRLRRRRLAPGR